SDGTQTRQSASFSSGLHIPNTPFPGFPLGALLLVELPRDATALGEVRQIHQLQPTIALAFPQQADLYLVVNDAWQDSCKDDANPGELRLTVSLVQSVGNVAEKLGKVMAAQLKTIRNKAQDYIDARYFAPGERDLLQQQAVQALTDPVNGLGAQPPQELL